jgi:tetratricopeptide (TPR) repeat protein
VAEAEGTGRRLARERGIHLVVQLGIHTGVVVVRELRGALQSGLYDLVGSTPERAARLAELAGPGEILVSKETQRLLHSGFVVAQAGESVPLGSSEAADVFRLIRDAPRGPASGELRREAPLVGRESELGRLKEAWSHARGGRGEVVLISGEAGIGKSRLLRELRREVAHEVWLECSCAAENQSTPLRPISELVQSWDVDVEQLLEEHGYDLSQTMPLFAAYLSLPHAERYTPLRLPPDRQKELALGAIVGLFLRVAEERPLVLAVEDLHWGDPTTIDFVALLVREMRSAEALAEESRPRILLLLTARPEFQPTWSLADVSIVRVPRLARSEVEQLVAAGLGGRTGPPEPVLDEVVRRADGIPLFVEEVTRTFLESPRSQGHAFASERVRLEIPATLRDLLAARLDSVSDGARETAQLAALLGREFRFELLRAVTQRSEDKLREDLVELESSDLLHARRGVSAESYVFKHALVRDTAYESIVTSVRCALHQRVASVLQERFPDIARRRPDVIAQHLEAAGENASAAVYWHRAAEIALRSAAYVEAIQLLERALALLAELPESRDRTRSEIEIRSTLGVALYSSRGYGAEEVGQTFARIHELSAGIGSDVSIKVLSGSWGFFITRSDRATVLEQLPAMRRLAERGEDPVARFAALLGLSAVDFWQGSFAAAREHALAAQVIYRTDRFQSFLRTTGYEAALFCFAWDMLSQLQLGYPDQAAETGRELLVEGERARDPYSLPIALGHAALLAIARGDVDTTIAHADRLLALAQEQNLLLWFAASLCARSGALLLQGRAEEAIGPVQQGLAVFQAIGVRSSYSSYLSTLANAYLEAGRVDEGLAVTREGLGLCESQLARFHRPDLLRLEGELLLRKHDDAAAEARLREALDLSVRGGARAMALRAAASLAQLLRARGEGYQAKEVLQRIYGSFTEGLDTRDLRHASALLDELS